MINIYTDGACSGNPGPGGRGVVIIQNLPATGKQSSKLGIQNGNNSTEITKLSGKKKHTTNNEMELTAVIEGLKRIFKNQSAFNIGNNNSSSELSIEIYLDSQYVKKGIEERIITWRKNNWKNYRKKTIAHVTLRQELDLLVGQLSVTRHWVKGHNGDKYNEMADRLATCF